MPFWYSERRALNLISKSPAYYKAFKPFRIDWDKFCLNWVPDLTKDGLQIGVNWTGKRAIGYDMEPEEVKLKTVAALKSACRPSEEA